MTESKAASACLYARIVGTIRGLAWRKTCIAGLPRDQSQVRELDG